MEEERRRGRPRINPLPDPNEPKKGRGRPRIHPLSDKPKKPQGRPFIEEGVYRVRLGFFVPAEQEDWLNEMKAKTGKSWGELIDGIVERYKDGE